MLMQNWITIVLFGLGVVGTILMGQHALITNLLKDRWAAHEKLHADIEERLADREADHAEIALKVNTLETAFGMMRGLIRHDGNGKA